MASQPSSDSISAPPFKYIVTLVEENHPLDGFSGVYGNTADAPYTNQLVQNGSLLTNYHDTANTGSLSQYLGMISGNSPCMDDPADSNACVQYGRTIVDNIEASGRTWKAFMEDYPLSCPVSDPIAGRCNSSGCFIGAYSYGYLDNHNPFIYFPSIANNSTRCANILPADDQTGWKNYDNRGWGHQVTPNLLLDYLDSPNPANYIYFVPTHCDSFHGPFTVWPCDPYTCNNGDTDCLHNQVKAGDNYLSYVVPAILSSKLFQTGEAVLYIAFDEPNTHPTTPGICPNPTANVASGSEACPIFGFWIGPMIKKSVSNTFYTHYSYLKTIEDAWQLPTLTGNDAAASPMTEFFKVPFPIPKAYLKISPTYPVVGETVTLTASMPRGIPQFKASWDFGDGSGQTTGLKVTHEYTTNGTFTPKVTVTDSAQHTDSASQSIPVTLPLSVSFSYSPSDLASGTKIQFFAQITGGLEGYSYSWKFGDGATDTASSPIHVYDESGVYDVGLTVSDQLQHLSYYRATLRVNPMAGFISINNTAPFDGDVVTFTGTVKGGMAPYAVSWNFGDGNQGIGNSTYHSYARDGIYRVVLNISDSAHIVAGTVLDITVSKTLCSIPSSCKITMDTSNPVSGQRILFKAITTGGAPPNVYTWYFGDGATGRGDLVQHAYAESGTYTTRLVVKDNVGHSYSTSNTFTVGNLKTSNLTGSIYNPFLLIAFASGVAVSAIVFWYKSRLFGRFRD